MFLITNDYFLKIHVFHYKWLYTERVVFQNISQNEIRAFRLKANNMFRDITNINLVGISLDRQITI